MVLMLFVVNGFSQKQFNCLDWKSNVTVNTFLVQKMHEQYNERRKEFAHALISKKLEFQNQNVKRPFFGIENGFIMIQQK